MNRRVSGVALILLALTVLFFLRVAGQALVAFLGVSWLPAMEAWYSGLLPYPILFPTQVAILMIQGVIDVAVWRGHRVLRDTSSTRRAGAASPELPLRPGHGGALRHHALTSDPHRVSLDPRRLPLHPRARAQCRPNTSFSSSVVRAAGLARIWASCSPTTMEETVERLADDVVVDVVRLRVQERESPWPGRAAASYCWVTPTWLIDFSTTGVKAAVSWGVVLPLK